LLLIAVYEIVNGQHSWFSHCIVSLVAQKRVINATNLNVGLSQREMQILSMIAHGYDNQQIAKDLCLSLGTIKNYVTNIYLKVQVNTRAGAVAWAWQYGLIKSDVEQEILENSASHRESHDLQILKHG
jgi:DNA-binding NarL/FixJ family response regulator